ncbi:uncharacterized protein PV09_01339 [Verruconis gallopava]|uniref:Transcription factor domain-containing protein n=1 Tax=Verruconis gallopava TaxID=253628 RepID=A0A0D1Y058_9PEZI|nr:uncharacterized protein PV09_01339 [Verruconis gallopava]KIW08436.1 hypothetical protein PV09_01339 [Verruconis gallopava]
MSTFQYENILLPDEPVLLVNRDWQVPGRKPRKSKKLHEGQFSGKVHSFKNRSQTQGSRPIQFEPLPLKTKNSLVLCNISSEKTSIINKRCARNDQEREDPQHHKLKTSLPSHSSSHVGGSSHAKLPGSTAHAILAGSQTGTFGRRQCPGADACLLRLTNYDTPSFIPKARYFDFYINNIGDLMYPLKGKYLLNPLRSVWLPIVLVDELWFYSILYTVARHLHASPDHGDHERQCLYLADMLFQRLRRRLEMSSDGDGLTDVDCAAVSCLLSIEHNFGTKEALAHHAKGLATFISKRGGVNRISGVLRTKICRADVEAAIDFETEPAIIYPDKTEVTSLQRELPGPAAHYTEHPAYSAVLRYLSVPLAGIASDLMSLVWYLESETASSKLLNPFTIDEKVLNLEYRLVRYKGDNLTLLDNAFRTACMIFIKCIITPISRVRSTSTALVNSLLKYVSRTSSLPYPLSLWILYMGQIAICELDYEKMAISSMLTNELRSKAQGTSPTWSTVKSHLKKIAWVDSIFDQVGEKIWTEFNGVTAIKTASS